MPAESENPYEPRLPGPGSDQSDDGFARLIGESDIALPQLLGEALRILIRYPLAFLIPPLLVAAFFSIYRLNWATLFRQGMMTYALLLVLLVIASVHLYCLFTCSLVQKPRPGIGAILVQTLRTTPAFLIVFFTTYLCTRRGDVTGSDFH